MGEEITEIPFTGGSDKIPTGAMRFEDDWPGVFIRGDNAWMLKLEIEQVLEILKENNLEASTMYLDMVRDIIHKNV